MNKEVDILKERNMQLVQFHDAFFHVLQLKGACQEALDRAKAIIKTTVDQYYLAWTFKRDAERIAEREIGTHFR